jgi:hypothetical protein
MGLVLAGLGKAGFRCVIVSREGVGPLKCHYHPRADATAVCSVCGIALCNRCVIEDRGRVYCDGCYAREELEDRRGDAAETEELEDSEDYIDIELMDILDTDDDDGLL